MIGKQDKTFTPYVGNTKLDSVYQGNTLIWSAETVTRALKFTATASQTLRLYNSGNTVSVQYSYDGTTFSTWNGSALTFGNGTAHPALYIRGNNPNGWSKATNQYTSFAFGNQTAMVDVKGNLMHLIDYTRDLLTIPVNFCFKEIFNGERTSSTGMTALRTVDKNLLPATSLTENCYTNMFNSCKNLINMPDLPAKTLKVGCYTNMFARCSSLRDVTDILPATTLANTCYQWMFGGCSSITIPPDIKATTLASGCCVYMFSACTNMTTSPELLAPTLTNRCYDAMFIGCSKLKTIKCMCTTTPSATYMNNWVSGVSSSGVFIYKSGVTWGSGASGIPTNWTKTPIT